MEEDEEGEDQLEVTKEIIELMKKERTKLKEAGLDVDFMISQLESLLKEIDDLKAHTEGLKREMLRSLSEPKDQRSGPYTAPTEHLDMAAPNLRKDEDVIEYFKRLRRRLERSADEDNLVAGQAETN